MTSPIYRLAFTDKAAKDWSKLDGSIKAHFSSKLDERLNNPRIRSAALRGMRDCYRIKLRDLGYRLVYQVFEKTVTVMVISIGKRDGNEVYREAARRLQDLD